MSTSRTIQSLEEEIASLKKEKRGLESVSVEKQTKIDVLAKEIEGLNDYDTRRNTEFENLQGEISRLESRLTSKESQLEDSRQLYDNQLKLLETQVKDFKANCNRVEGELSKTTTEAIELKLTLQAVEAERAQFNDQLQLSKAELSHLRGVVDDLTAENTKITEENETATIVARSGNRTLDEELSEEIDERGNFSPQVTEHEALDFSNILSVETTPGFAADDPKRTSSEISDSVDSALGFSMISASEQVPATPLSLRFNPIKTANTPVKLTYSRISSVDQAPEIRHRRSRFKPFGSFLEHRKSFSPTVSWPHFSFPYTLTPPTRRWLGTKPKTSNSC